MSNRFLKAMEWPGPLDTNAKRIEIDEFIKNNDMTNLFLLALYQMQRDKIHGAKEADQENWFSFYNLAAIHGDPSEWWNGIPNGTKEELGFTNDEDMQRVQDFYDYTQYCTHGSNVFPTWHRVYMNVYEQAIYHRMKALADQFEEQEGKEKYQNALKAYRLPYWDPIFPRERVAGFNNNIRTFRTMFGLPEILSADQVYVKWPAAVKDQPNPIPNPLYSFRYPLGTDRDFRRLGRPSVGDSWLRFGSTYRSKTIDANIKAQAQNLSITLWQLLVPDPNTNKGKPSDLWDKFANHRLRNSKGEPIGRAPPSVSLESWHDRLHGIIGGNMGYPSVAAFDPMFWLHHNNIERIHALRQALYPDQYVQEDTKDQDGRPQIHAKSSLFPFKKDAKQCYNSADVREWTELGWAMPGKEQSIAGDKSVKAYLQDTYYWSSSALAPPKEVKSRAVKSSYALFGDSAEPEEDVSFIARENNQVVLKTFSLKADAAPTTKIINTAVRIDTSDSFAFPSGTLQQNGKSQRTWNALISVRKYAFKQSFFVHVFFDDPDPEEKFLTADTEVAFSFIFAGTPEGDCDNCRRADSNDMKYEDAIPLTGELPNYLTSNRKDGYPAQNMRILENLEPVNVVPFLTKHMKWRIVTADGNTRTAEEVTAARLKILVADRMFELPTDQNPFGAYGEYTFHPEITAGKAGGFS